MTPECHIIRNALQAAARELWAKARDMEAKGEAESVGLSNATMEEASRAMSRSSSFFGQATGFERSAWLVLARSSFGEPLDADFFEKQTQPTNDTE